MSLAKLLRKVEQAENAAEAQERRTAADWRQCKRSWRAAWTPGRTIIAGLISGYAIGSGKVGTAATSNALRLMASLSAFMASHQATEAAEEAEGAAHSAEDTAGDVAEQAGVDPGRESRGHARAPTATAEAYEYEEP